MTNPLKTALIIGASGFLGRYIARQFYSSKWNTIGIDLIPPENAPLSSLTQYVRLELPDRQLVALLKELKPDVCIHCAGRASIGESTVHPSADFYAGTVLTFEVLNSLRNYAPECRFIFLSSAAVYGNPDVLPVCETHFLSPISPYGFHKWQCEILCREFAQVYGLRTASVRIFSAYGAGLRRQVIWDICRKALTLKSVVLNGTGKESRDFIHALDVAEAIFMLAGSAEMNGDVYNLASGEEVSIIDLANIILEFLSSDSRLDFDGIVPPGTPLNWRADITQIKRIGFTPQISLNTGLKSFVRWCEAEWAEI